MHYKHHLVDCSNNLTVGPSAGKRVSPAIDITVWFQNFKITTSSSRTLNRVSNATKP